VASVGFMASGAKHLSPPRTIGLPTIMTPRRFQQLGLEEKRGREGRGKDDIENNAQTHLVEVGLIPFTYVDISTCCSTKNTMISYH